MNPLVTALFSYAIENHLDSRFVDDPEYSLHLHYGEKALQRLYDRLDEAGQKDLECYLDEQGAADRAEMESLFIAGLSIGLSLSRLG